MIDILMATYNGEKYLDTQISSIVSQTYKNWRLYIHDDGSSDSTVQIIKKWASFDSRVFLIDDGIVFHNSGANFLHLLRFSESEYICFCDQDDYWLDCKLEKMLGNFPKDIDLPYLLCSSCCLWNEDAGKIAPDFTFSKINRLNEILFCNGGLQGCAMMFNSKLKNLVKKEIINNINMHDFLISLLAIEFGKIGYLDDELFLYRQHSGSVTIHPEINRKKTIKKQIFSHKVFPVVTKIAFNDAKQFYENYSDSICEKDKKIFQKYFELPSLNFFKRFFIILFSSFSIKKNGHLKLIAKLFLRPFFA